MKMIRSRVEIWDKPATRDERTRLIERAGRVCYKSEDRISDYSAADFISGIVKRGHLSVLEHGNIIIRPSVSTFVFIDRCIQRFRANGICCYIRATRQGADCIVSGNVRAWVDFFSVLAHSNMFGQLPPELSSLILHNLEFFYAVPRHLFTNEMYAAGLDTDPCEVFNLSGERADTRSIHEMATLRFIVDRGVSHELVRHRTLSFSQESTRYCNYSKDKFGREITVIQPEYAQRGTVLYSSWYVGCISAENAYFSMLDSGSTAQEARTVLPNSLKTEVVVSGHYDDLARFLRLRNGSGAHPDMRKVAGDALYLLKERDPGVFADE